METVLVDGEWLEMTLPEGFERVPHDELEAFMGFKYDRMLGVRDTARHMLMCITWKDSQNRIAQFFTKIVTEKMFVNRVDEAFGVRYRAGGYRRAERFERAVPGASAQASGFHFSYSAEGVARKGVAMVFKRDIRCYTLVYYTRAEVAEENRPVFEGIVESLEVR